MAAAEPDLRKVIGLRIARMRVARGESQEEVSLRAGINRTAVGQLERGERVPKADTLVKVAGALEVDAGELLAKLLWTRAGGWRRSIPPRGGCGWPGSTPPAGR